MKKNIKYILGILSVAIVILLYGTVSPVWHVIIASFINGSHVAIPLGIGAHNLDPVLTYVLAVLASIVYTILMIYGINMVKRYARKHAKTYEKTEHKQSKLERFILKVIKWLKADRDPNMISVILVLVTTSILGSTSGIVVSEMYSLRCKKYVWLVSLGILINGLIVTAGSYWVFK